MYEKMIEKIEAQLEYINALIESGNIKDKELLDHLKLIKRSHEDLLSGYKRGNK